MRYLLAAEADKIQEFVFRSSRLREVVGASQLLSRFCQEGIGPLPGKYGGQTLVNDGGSFRIVFEGENAEDVQHRAKESGSDLAELYQLALGGSLSVGEPVPLDGSFPDANKEAGKKLRRAKEHRQGVIADPHMPYVAYCASCGVELAVTHYVLSGEPMNARPRYLCQICQDKAQQRYDTRDTFIGAFTEATRCHLSNPSHVDELEITFDADKFGGFDLSGRNYVAYLVADGNAMGRIFGNCSEDQISRLSAQLPRVVLDSLAQPTAELIEHLCDEEDDAKHHAHFPVLPLILGGDDVFVLLPAPYALDFARSFSLAFEREMAQMVRDLKNVPRPTMSAAVIICKSKYPYALAHHRGEELLKEAKRISKRLAARHGEYHSVVNFEVILGNRLAGQVESDETNLIGPSLRPYWVADERNPLSEAAFEYGIDLQTLLQQRLSLKDVPNKRLHEIRRRFDDLPQISHAGEVDSKLGVWTKTLRHTLQRSGHEKKLWQAMSSLSNGESVPKNPQEWKQQGDGFHFWRWVRRGDRDFVGHGFLDLLQVWHFAQDLCCGPEEYEPQEESEREEETP